MLFDQIEKKDWSVWAVIVNNTVMFAHTGHPDLFVNPFPDDVNVSLVQYSLERGVPKVGDIWTGERFIKNV